MVHTMLAFSMVGNLNLFLCVKIRSTVADIRQTCCEVLVEAHTERICADAETFLVNNQTDDLHRLFMLFSELPKEHALISFKVGALRG